MPLRRKLLLAMLIPAVLIGLVGVTGLYSLLHLEQAAGRILADNYQSIQEARNMERTLRLLETHGDGDSPADRERLTSTFETSLRRCESNITESGEPAVLQRIRSAWDRVGAGDSSAVDSLWEDLHALVSLNERAMIASEVETRRVARVMLWAVTGSALTAMVALAFFAVASAQRISHPVTEVADRLHLALNPVQGQQVAKHVDLDEITRLRRELDALLERLQRYEDEHNQKLDHLQGRLAFVMNEVLEGLVLLDGNHKVVTMNRVARAILAPEGAEGVRLETLALRDDVRSILSPLLAGERQAERDLGELRFELDGEERTYRPRVVTVRGADGSVLGYLLLFWDVTEQRRFEESRRRFISMLSHQLKTPMTSLSMAVNLLRERLGDGSAAQGELMSIAAESCNSLSSLISDLIEASREVTPDLVLRRQRVDVTRLLCSALRPLIPQAEERGVFLIVPACEPSIVATVDPVKFPWVVTNIAGNALRYTERGGRIEVGVRRSEGHLLVTISDTGAGIAPENLARIFEPYVTLEPEPKPGSHGLGLAIAREIVEAHGARIEAHSELGRGTEFVIRLPHEPTLVHGG
jgi:signal transduction histidine kinase